MINEFALIRRYLTPLAQGFSGSLNLADDAALLDIPANKQLVVTKDAMVSGIHFTGHEPAELIARKLLRVNLSDLAAKGAVPYCYLLAGCLPKDTTEDWIAGFANGLAEDQKIFAIHLAGGDTTATDGLLTLSLTALGLVDKNHMLTRTGAKEGDDIYVSGTLGKAAIGLAAPQNEQITEGKNYYLLPEPHLQLGQKLIGIASSCMDISDGLMQDLGHICAASNVGAAVEKAALPLADSTYNWQELISFGDDYELLFTAPASQQQNIITLSQALSLPLTRIGRITSGSTAQLLDSSGSEIKLKKTGWQHF